MITEKIVISDTNILLDLLSQNILEDFFSLPCEICTTDLLENLMKINLRLPKDKCEKRILKWRN